MEEVKEGQVDTWKCYIASLKGKGKKIFFTCTIWHAPKKRERVYGHEVSKILYALLLSK